ncbi:transporter substrate-binding domain-containing protein [Pseudomonas lalucatii]|uniref:Transporter substrate-binding domain-containing protein n=1 Tax=Pseudomonas lalucatii TaxID=1424203 RepID=A0ABS5Q844_9PSED|nr:transporter substrate-binding domain-containing protein [Pseudomonas lalucatii]MBS7664366.1 transporter substrate-binding domain-containing protein [Pseudomonas lalucatii]
MTALLRALLALLLLAAPGLSAHGQPLRIVSEAWAPYVYEERGQLRGLDYEATAIVLQRLGIDAEWQLMPWKRCLAALQQGQADAILDVFQTAERQAGMLFPAEPLSEVEFVLFHARARPHPFRRLADLHGLKVGVSAGYWYANRAFRESTAFTREPAPDHAANFGKLLRNRVDLVINDHRAGHYLLSRMNLSEAIGHSPRVVSRDRLYLGLRRDAELEKLAVRFAEALRRFKGEPAYTALLERYASPSTTHATPAPEAEQPTL